MNSDDAALALKMMIKNTNTIKCRYYLEYIKNKWWAYFFIYNCLDWQSSIFFLKLYCKRLVKMMYQNKLNLTPDDILEKEFKIDTRGYRLKEVDQFLDLVIQDYQTLINIIKKQETEKDELSDEILRLKQQVRDASVDVEIAKASSMQNVGTSNVDILKRLSNLEKVIFGNNNNE